MEFGRTPAGALPRGLLVALLCCATPGCAMLNSFLDPTTVGAFPSDYRERGIRRVLTPRESPPGLANATEPMPDDLTVKYEDYRIGPGDQLAIVIEDLLAQGAQEGFQIEVSPTGYVRVPQLGSIKAGGLTETELEQEIKTQLKAAGLLPNAIVRVFAQVKRQRFFTIIGDVTAAGPYAITDPDTRLLDAIGVARDIGPAVKKLYVIRREQPGARDSMSHETPAPAGDGLVIPPPTEDENASPAAFFSAVGAAAQETTPTGKGRENNDMRTLEEIIAPQRKAKAALPPDVKRESDRPFAPMIFDPQSEKPAESAVETKAAPEIERPGAPRAKNGFNWENTPELDIAQRVIEIDVVALRGGDPRYNIVLRNRDVIQVPSDTGVFYLMGEINRPGVYAFGGREITMKQALAIGGGLTPLGWPQRCEIIRREQGTDKQVIIPVNLDQIFAGLQDDVLLRDEDIVNFGTHTVAPFLFVIRNSFRFTYGFGFVYDRNFADRDSYGSRLNPEIAAQQRRAQRGLPF